MLTAKARIIGAEEAVIDVSQMGEEDPQLVQGDLKVKLLLRHPRKVNP